MDDDMSLAEPRADDGRDPKELEAEPEDQLAKLKGSYEARLVVAHLRTEAVRAGMIDLDGLKLIDLSSVKLGSNDEIVGGHRLMEELRRNKPWLFSQLSSSSAAPVPTSLPVRPKTAMEMSEEEYLAARAAVTKSQF